ncbi:MAG: PLP-dependent transferase [Acidimicrobiales bacterium]
MAEQQVRDYIKHTGSHMSSRHAEDVLLAAGELIDRQAETTCEDEPERRVVEALATAYGLQQASEVSLHNSGMNAVHAALAALTDVQRTAGRTVWIQLGWIFFDTVRLFERQIVRAEHVVLPSPFDLRELACLVEQRGAAIAGVITEVPSNPLVQTPDLKAVRRLADAAGCAVVLDATLGTPCNVDILRYADIVCESLTKYATGSADVLMGATIINPDSRWAEELRAGVGSHGDAPYHRDTERVADRIVGYPGRMEQVNRNTMALVELLAGQAAVEHVFWAYEECSAANYEQIARAPDAPGGVLMLDLRVPLEQIYDRLAVAKGPSFGAEFTMAAPQVFIAHFDMLSTDAGREALRARGLHRDMLRVSVGTEPVDDLVATFADAFEGAT